MRKALLIIGIAAALMGMLWIGQGTGLCPYPKQSFMIGQMPWAYRGVALALVGFILVFLSRRR